MNLLFTIGAMNPDGQWTAEIVDISGANRICPYISNFPVQYGSVGTYINGEAMVCTGTNPPEFTNECYTYDPSSDTWIFKNTAFQNRSIGIHSSATIEDHCALNIRPHPPKICISKRGHPRKNFIKK